MESSIFRQIAELAREHKTAARATAVFLCLALVVSAATVGILTYTGHAMTQKVKVLTCPLVVHEHTPACRDAEGNLICGYADYVVHIHNDDCLDENGALVCSLPEVYPHTHDDSCYGEVKTLICGQEEAKGHEHTDECYLRERGELTCTQAEHTHGDACFIREEVLTCNKTEQEHIHTDACYTVSRDLSCGQEEGEGHTHSDACYTETRTLTCDKTTEPHNHGPECYTVNETLICEIPEHTHTDDCYAWTETLICEIPEGQIPEGGHVHTDECYEISQGLICGKLEKHEHTDKCFVLDGAGNRTGNPICGQIELLEHVHGEDCFTIEERTEGQGLFFVELFETDSLELTCGKTAHTHDDSCLDENGQLVCGLEEHSHDDSCYSASLTAETPEDAEAAETAEGAPAEEAAPVYLCGKEEHTHDDSCLDENGEVVCGLEEHTHSDTCLPLTEETYETLCGKAEHQHSDACLDENGQIACGLEEHVHDASCLAVPDGVFVKTWKDAGTLITARYTDEAQLPEDAVLQAYRVTPEQYPDRYEDRVESALDALGEGSGAGATMLVYNIGFFTADGEEVEPLAPVTITIQFLDANGLPTGSPVKVVHFGKDGVTTMDGSTVDGSNSTSFVTDSFSDFSFFLPPFLTDIALIGENDPALTAEVPAGRTDLKPFLTNAELWDGNQQIPEDGEVQLGHKYTYKVHFDESAVSGGDFKNPMYFQMPENIKCDPQSNVSLTDPDGNIIGHFDIDENGLVTVYVDEDYLQKHKNVGIDLSFGILATENSSQGGLDLPWAGGTSKHFTTDTGSNAGVTKTAGDYDPATHTVGYTVEVNVTQGVLNNPKLKDTMEQGVSVLSEDGKPTDYEIKVYDEDGRDITPNPPPTLVKTKDGWKTQGLPETLVKGQKVVITYKAQVDLDTPAEEGGFQFAEEDGKAVENRFDFTVDNKVVLTADVPGKGDPAEWPADEQVHVVDEQLKKNGSHVNDKIDWEIEIGSGSTDVTDWNLTDTLSDGQKYDQSQKLEVKWKDSTDDTIKTYKVPWSEDGSTGLKVSEDGPSYELNLKKAAEYAKNYSGETWWSGSDDDADRTWEPGDWIKVEYYTTYDPIPEGQQMTYTNSVNSFYNDIPLGVDGKIVVGNGSITKYLVSDEKGKNGEPGYLTYSTQLVVPSYLEMQGEMKDKNEKEWEDGGTKYCYFYVEDELRFSEASSGDALVDDPRRFFVDNYPEIDSIVAKFEDGSEIKFHDLSEGASGYTYEVVHTSGSEDGRVARQFRIYFNSYLATTERDDHHRSLWTFDKPCTLTITYRIRDDARLVIDAGEVGGVDTYEQTDLTLRELLDQGRKLTNLAKGKYRSRDTWQSEASYSYPTNEPGLSKTAKLLDDGRTIEYRVLFRNAVNEQRDGKWNDYPIHVFTEQEVKDFTFFDEFDSRLEYVPGSLRVDVYEGSLKADQQRGTYTVRNEANITVYKGADGEKSSITAKASAFDVKAHEYGSSGDRLDHRKNLEAFMLRRMRDRSESNHGLSPSNFVFVYQLRVKGSAFTPEEMELLNQAHVKYGEEDYTDDAVVPLLPSVLEKNGERVDPKGDTMLYTLKINPGGANLAYSDVNGERVEMERYVVEDLMSKEQNLDWNSVEVYALNEDGTRGEQLKRVNDEADVTLGSMTYTLKPSPDGTNKFNLCVPDELGLEVTYSVKVNGTLNQVYDLWNEVTLYGKETLSDKEETTFKIQEASGGVTGNTSFRLYKMEAGSADKFLDGAEFDLYKAGTGGDATVTPVTPEGTAVSLEKQRGKIIPRATPDDNGQLGVTFYQVTDSERDSYFMLVETQAPDGHQLDPTPIVFRAGEEPEGGPETVTVAIGGNTWTVEVVYLNAERNSYTVYNTPDAFQLPESGGPGSGELYILGGALILASLTLYYTRPRKKESEG